MTKTLSRCLFLSSFVLLLFTACRNTQKPLTKEEVMDFAQQIETTIEKREPGFMDAAIDDKEMLKRTGIPSGKNEGDFKKGLAQSMKMGTAVIGALSPKGSYKLLRYYEKDKTPHLLFRLYDQGKINYHDMELKRTGGKCKIADMFIYLSGESFSETLFALYKQMESEIGSKMSDETVQWTRDMPRIRSLVNSGRNREAKEMYDALPNKIKTGRPFQIVHLQICSGLSNEEYDSALAEFERLYPNQPNIHLLMLDGYVIRNEYEKAINAVNELDKAVGHDPLLDFHRGMLYSLSGDAPKSRECLEQLNKNMPDFEDGMLELIKAYLMRADYEKANPLVQRFKTKSEFDQANLNTLIYRFPGYTSKYE